MTRRLLLGEGTPWFSSSKDGCQFVSCYITGPIPKDSILYRSGDGKTGTIDPAVYGDWSRVRLVLELVE